MGGRKYFCTHLSDHCMTIGPPIPEIQFDLENSRLKVKVKGTVVSLASSWLISFCFTSIGPTIPKIWQIECLIGENRFEILCKNLLKQKLLTEFESGGKHDQGDIPTKFCSDWMSGSHFIMGTSQILSYFGSLVTLIQGHQDGCKIFPATYRLTMYGLKKLPSGVFPKVEKCWQNTGGNWPKQ